MGFKSENERSCAGHTMSRVSLKTEQDSGLVLLILLLLLLVVLVNRIIVISRIKNKYL